MDFGSLLYKAQKNDQKQKEAPSRFYKTKFAPPKKEEKKQKNLSASIQKFLAAKEEEERKKAEEEKRKKENLLAMRSKDKKSNQRVQSMLKRTKSANKAVIDDAKDDVNTAVTAAGPYQCDEDDYGYVSQEAASAYNKLMEKYSQMPPEENKFSKKVVSAKDISSTRERVKANLQKEEDEKYLPHKRKRKRKDKENGDEIASDDEDDSGGKSTGDGDGDGASRKSDKVKEPKKPRKAMPPPMDFNELLKIAEAKQHEPVVVKKEAPAVKRQEPERLMTKKEKMEYEQERERRLRREREMALANRRKGEGVKTPISAEKNPDKRTPATESEENLPVEERLKKTGKVWSSPSNLTSDKNSNLARKKVMDREREILKAKNSSSSKKSSSNDEDRKPNGFKSSPSSSVRRDLHFDKSDEKPSSILKSTLQKPLSDSSKSDKSKKVSLPFDKSKSLPSKDAPKSREFPPKDVKPRQFPPKDVKPRGFPPKDVKPREFPPKDVKPREFPPRDVKPREFPPRDLYSRKPFHEDSRSRPGQLKKKPLKVVKRRIESDEDEYDSELDDFICDDDEDAPNEVSKAISEIFGYDKSRYRYVDDDEDDAAMESSFHQVEKEEFHSTRIGIMEDLEDIRREKEEEKRKKERRLKQQKLTQMSKLKKR